MCARSPFAISASTAQQPSCGRRLEKRRLRTPLPGTANLSNVLAAAAVAIRFDVPLADIVERAAGLKPVARRGEVIRAGGVTIVDDSYNSNPKALSRALAMLAGETRFARRVADHRRDARTGCRITRAAPRGGRRSRARARQRACRRRRRERAGAGRRRTQSWNARVVRALRREQHGGRRSRRSRS